MMNSKTTQHVSTHKEGAGAKRPRPFCLSFAPEVFSRYYLFTIHYFLLSYKKHFSKHIYVCVKNSVLTQLAITPRAIHPNGAGVQAWSELGRKLTYTLFAKCMNEAADSTMFQISSSCVEWWSSFVCSLRFDLFYKVFELYKLCLKSA